MSQGPLRTFVAVALPAPVTAALGELADRIRATGLRGRWVPTANIHLTLAFLGDTAVERVSSLGAALTEAVSGCAAFDLVPAGLGVFPDPRRARVLWVGLKDASEALATLTDAVYKSLTPLGFRLPKRSATGHLTLARAKDQFDGRFLFPVLETYRDFAAPAFRVESIVLYRSVLGSGPARYIPLATAALAGAGISCDTGGKP